jgi:hypothetical protein
MARTPGELRIRDTNMQRKAGLWRHNCVWRQGWVANPDF